MLAYRGASSYAPFGGVSLAHSLRQLVTILIPQLHLAISWQRVKHGRRLSEMISTRAAFQHVSNLAHAVVVVALQVHQRPREARCVDTA